MNRWMGLCVAALVCVLAAGCSKTQSDQDAIRATIDKRLSERMDLNMGAMDHDVKDVSINGDHASAQVEFRLKGGAAGSGMVIAYDLQRKGKEWTVLSSEPMSTGHPGDQEKLPEGSVDPGQQ